MPLDAVCLSALARELEAKLVGGRIDKIQQPERNMVVLSLRSNGENLRLLISSGTGTARIHLTNAVFENPSEPPMFCMLLRKHLTGARILSVTQTENERMLTLELAVHDELGFESRRCLISELIGRSSNLILTDADGRIIDCMRRMSYGGDELRRMMPGMFYRKPPVQAKPALLNTGSEEIKALVSEADRERPIDKWMLDSFSGVSPLICRELSYRAGGDRELLPAVLEAFTESVRCGEMKPYLLCENGKPKDFSFMRISQYGDEYTCSERDSFSELLDEFYSSRDRLEQQRRRAHELTKTVRTLRDRQQKKLAFQSEELKRTEGREELRKRAELITANIYRMKKGDRVLSCQDYYDEECPTVEIELDPLKTPQQNAAAMFREYNKLKAAREHLTVLLDEGGKKLDYLNSVLELLDSAETEKDISDLRRELAATGFIRKTQSKKNDKSKAQAPIRFVTDDGFEVLVGRSNLQNDELTTKTGRRSDWWLHTQKIHGSHVILRTEDTVPTPLSLEQAAQIAAYYSQGRGGGKTAVDYTMLKNVRKPSGALPGKVIYTDYKTMTVVPDEALVTRLRKGK